MPRVYKIIAGRTGEARRITRDVKARTIAAMQEGLQFARSTMIQRKWVPVNRGQLQQSIRARVITTGDRLVGTLGTPLLHGLVMELGRKPKRRMPPFKAIETWATNKGKTAKEVGARFKTQNIASNIGRRFRVNTTGGFAQAVKRARAQGETQAANIAERTRNQMIFRIQRAIARDGIRVPLETTGAGKMFQRTATVMQKEWPRILNRRLLR